MRWDHLDSPLISYRSEVSLHKLRDDELTSAENGHPDNQDSLAKKQLGYSSIRNLMFMTAANNPTYTATLSCFGAIFCLHAW